MKKLLFAFCLAFMSLTTAASAQDVYITSAGAAASTVEIYAMDETVNIRGDNLSVDVKFLYPSGNTEVHRARFSKPDGGWQASVGRTDYGYVVSWPDYVSDIFDWLMNKKYR